MMVNVSTPHRTASRRRRGGVVAGILGVSLIVTTLVVPSAQAVAPSGVPSLTAPGDGETVSSNPLLQWTPVSGAVKYRVQVSPSTSFSPMTYTVDTVNTSATPAAELLPNGNFFWRVAATDGGSGVGTYSPLGQFTKVAGGAPPLVAPADGATFSYPAQTPVLKWEPLAGVKSYSLEIDDEDAFVSPITATTSNTAFTISTALTYDKPYFWRVRGTNAAGIPTAWSDARTFNVTWPLAAGKPQLIEPADTTATSISDVVLRWAPVDGAKNYLLDVSPNPDFTNNLIESNKVVFGTQYSPSESYPNGGYFWRVRPVDTLLRQGPWSDSWSFLRGSPAPAAPSLVGPADLEPADEWRFQWTSVPNAGAYEFQYDTNGSFVTGVKGCTTYHTTFTGYVRPGQPAPAPTLPGNPVAPTGAACAEPLPGTYFWRVRAIDTTPSSELVTDGIFGPWSVTSRVNFALPATPPVTTPALVSTYLAPANCEAPCLAPLTDTPELRWQASADATNYLVRIANDRAFTNEVQRYQVAATHLTPRESLPDNSTGKSYYWYVQPCQGTVTSPVRCAAVDQATLEAGARAFRKVAEPVTLQSPNGGTQVTDVVALQWNDLWADQPLASGAGAYRVQIATDEAFTNVIDVATVDQKRYMAFTKTYPDGAYFWRVQALDGSQLGLSWSTPRTFTKTSTAPTSLASTKTDAASALPLLSWSSVPYVSGYVVQIYSGTDPNFPANRLVKEVTVKLPSYAPDAALPEGDYSWRVRRLDPSGNPGPWQDKTNSVLLPTFTVAAPMPALISPANGTTIKGNSILLVWSSVKGASQYRVESSTSASFASPIESIVTVMNQWAPSIAYPDSTTIHWRVRALDGAGNALSTALPRTFVKDAASPTVAFVVTGASTQLRPTITATYSENVSNVTSSTLTLRRATGSAVVSASRTCTTAGGSATSCAGPSVRVVSLKPTSNVVPGETYTVASTTGIADGVGNAGVAASQSFRALLKVEQNSGSPVLSSGWSSVSSSLASGGSYARTATKSASVSWSFKGGSPKVSFIASPSGGQAAVYIDGKYVKTLDQYRSSSAAVTTSLSLASGSHTIKVISLGRKSAASKGTYVSIDAFSTT